MPRKSSAKKLFQFAADIRPMYQQIQKKILVIKTYVFDIQVEDRTWIDVC